MLDCKDAIKTLQRCSRKWKCGTASATKCGYGKTDGKEWRVENEEWRVKCNRKDVPKMEHCLCDEV